MLHTSFKGGGGGGGEDHGFTAQPSETAHARFTEAAWRVAARPYGRHGHHHLLSLLPFGGLADYSLWGAPFAL